MNGACVTARIRFPWNRLAERIINFENTWRVSEQFQSPPIARRQSLSGDSQKFPHRNVQKNSPRSWQLIQIFDGTIDLDIPAELTQITCERIGNLLRTTARNRPAHDVSRQSEHQREG